jgi:hypothetical protein
MDPLLLLILRALHVLGGVFWAGSTSLLARFALPAALRQGGVVTKDMLTTGRLGTSLAGAGAVTTFTGLPLYWTFYAGHSWNFGDPGPAELFGLGGLLGFAALLFSIRFGVSLSRLARDAGDGEELEALARSAVGQARILMLLLVPATVLMGVARYS